MSWAPSETLASGAKRKPAVSSAVLYLDADYATACMCGWSSHAGWHNSAMAMSEHARVAAPGSVAPDGSSAALDCLDLHKRFGEVEAVRGVSFKIAEGETFGLLGPNGAGKTTTISMVCGLLEPDSGAVFVAGKPLTSRSVAEKAAIGYVPQELAIYPDLSARENLEFFARLYGLAPDLAHARVEEVLRVVGLAERASEQTKNYLRRDAAEAKHRHRAVAPSAAPDPG